MTECKACGKCCNKHWIVRLTSKHEIELFGDDVVFGNYIWTDECKFLKDGKCGIHDNKPKKCKDYFCEGNL
jgi:Fe-S-cluster containining protein